MATFTYASPAGRINKMKGEILAHAVPVEVLGITGQQKPMQKGKGDTVIFRRFLPYGATSANPNTWAIPAGALAHLVAEGVTPAPDSLVPQDFTATLQQYAVLYQVTDKTVDLYEDDVPAEMKRQTGERMAMVREMVRYGVIRGGTNKFYGGTGTTRATVNGPISLSLLRRITRSLRANHTKFVTSILSPGPNFGTRAVEAAYIVYGSTDSESDFRNMAGFKETAIYASRKTVSDYELGSVENFRIVLSPELTAYANAGAAVGTTGMFSTNSVNIDVYPVIVCGEDAWGQVPLRGADAMDVTYLPPNVKDKNDPLGQRGYIGAKCYFTSLILNQGWMAIAEVGITATP